MPITAEGVNAWFLLAVSVVLTYCWWDNFRRTYANWREASQSPEDRADDLRAFTIGMVLFLASIAFVLGAISSYLVPDLLGLSRGFATVVRGAFLVLGIVTYITWRR